MSRFRLTVLLTLFRLGLQRGGRLLVIWLEPLARPASKCLVCWSAYEVIQYFEMK
jgi:hypothetical protein